MNLAAPTSHPAPGRRRISGAVPGSGGGVAQVGRGTGAFTLIELLLAMVIFAVVLSAISGVFFGAMRLRSRTTEAIESALPVQSALAVIRKDLAGLVLPTGTIQSNLVVNVSNGDGAAQASDMSIYTSTGHLAEQVQWSEVVKVAYALRPATNSMSGVGKDLVRWVTRNHLPPLQDEPEEQRLLAGVQRMEFSFYDGTSWRTAWNTTNEVNLLPRAIKVQLTMAQEVNQAGNRAAGNFVPEPFEIVVPILVFGTNNTSTATSTGGGTP
jgi:type II secretion system protein J